MPETPKSDIIPASPSAQDYALETSSTGGVRDLSWTQREDPILLFEDWLAEAVTSEVNDPHAMSLATVDVDSRPDVRVVLLKGIDTRGFVFYTNSESAKGEQLKAQAQAALCFHWKSLRRQVRVRGKVLPVSDVQSDAYFASRARGSQIGAWASEQSRQVAGREALLAAAKKVEDKYEGQDIPRPPHWYGWRVAPDMIEFWQDGAFRLHDRILFQSTAAGWRSSRLSP